MNNSENACELFQEILKVKIQVWVPESLTLTKVAHKYFQTYLDQTVYATCLSIQQTTVLFF